MHKAQLIAVDMDGTFLNNEIDYDRRQFADLYSKMRKHGIQLSLPAELAARRNRRRGNHRQ
jgi:hydroxymethylpyrimidine pyrophosphatase-like HAD family hydrolase